MPTYSYKCTECGNAFDVQQAFTDDSLTTCPVCEGGLRKVFNTIGVTFNGSGFYRTDSRAAAKAAKERGKAAKEPAAAGAGKGGGASSSAATSTSSSTSSSSSASSSSSSTSSSAPAGK